MEIESSNDHHQQTNMAARFFSRVWEKLKAKVMNVAKSTKKIGQDDPRRIIHSFKVGLALTFVSLFYYWRRLYDGFGVSGIWAIITVIVIMEFTVGASLYKGLNRSVATLLGGALGVGAQYLAGLCGQKGEPFILGVLVFILATMATFLRFFPKIKARHDYGMLIFILTFSMVSVSSFRVEEIFDMARVRLLTVLVGGSICLVVSIFVYPVWAGETLHNSVASSVEKLASFLEGFGGVYFHHSDDIVISKEDKSFVQGYKSVLNSKSIEESLANFAWWEPRHGNFKFRHPWKQYLKIGTLTRQCAYQIEALNGYTTSDAHVALQLRTRIQGPCTKMSSECGKALKSLASSIKTMTDQSTATNSHLENAKCAINELKDILKTSLIEDTDLLEIIPIASVASILVEIVQCVENISAFVTELSRLAEFKVVGESTVSLEKPHLLHRGSVNPVVENNNSQDHDQDHVVINVSEIENTISILEDKNDKAAKLSQK